MVQQKRLGYLEMVWEYFGEGKSYFWSSFGNLEVAN